MLQMCECAMQRVYIVEFAMHKAPRFAQDDNLIHLMTFDLFQHSQSSFDS
jgi:hypothetical protein